MVCQFAMRARRCANVFPRIKQQLLHPFFCVEDSETSSKKMSHLDACKVPPSAWPFFSAEGDKMPSKKRHILMSAVMFSTNGLWLQYFTENWACNRVVENTAPTEMAPKLTISLQTKSCLLFSIILKLLSGWEVIRTQGKCIKSYKNFWKDFVVEQNLEHSSEGRLLKLSESSIWDCSHLGWPHDWEYESLSHGPVSRANFDKFRVSCAW